MSTTISRRAAALAALSAAGLIVLSGCTSGGASGDSAAFPSATGIQGMSDDAGTPVDGGTFRYASLAPVNSLDPARTQATGATGGTELAAIYDVLMRYDPEAQEFRPQLAQSLESNSDDTVWTLHLRDGVTFSDGSPLDADAVLWSINRYNENRGSNSEIWTATVDHAQAVDPQTVKFTLSAPYSEFPAMLSLGQGMIVGRSSDTGDTFTAVGAGPFTVGRFAPPETLELLAREDYWDGRPHLDQLRFISISGDQPKLDTLRASGIDGAYLIDPAAVAEAKKQFPGYAENISLGVIGQMNSREGRPASDVRVRKAMAYAIDPAVIDERAQAGQGLPGPEVFQEWSTWYSDTDAFTPDPEAAKRLLDEAKQDGYNGTIHYVGVQSPQAQQTALAVEAMLESVGFEVSVDLVNSSTDMVRKLYVDHDYDLARAGNGLLDPAPVLRLYAGLYSESSNNASGFASPEMDAALEAAMSARTAADKRDKLADIQTLFNDQMPMLVWGARANYVPWLDSVHGVVPTLDGILLLGNAWNTR